MSQILRASGAWRDWDCGWRVPQTGQAMKSLPSWMRAFPSESLTVRVWRGGGPSPS
jgi:hypothetical protein